jgi:hypothetical protein
VAGGVAVEEVRSKYDDVTIEMMLKWNSTMPVDSTGKASFPTAITSVFIVGLFCPSGQYKQRMGSCYQLTRLLPHLL